MNTFPPVSKQVSTCGVPPCDFPVALDLLRPTLLDSSSYPLASGITRGIGILPMGLVGEITLDEKSHGLEAHATGMLRLSGGIGYLTTGWR